MINNRIIQTLYKEISQDELKNFDIGHEISKDDETLGMLSTQLAKAKGELNTILDRAAREGIIQKQGGKVKILNKEEYIKRIGVLPRKIKELQQKLEH